MAGEDACLTMGVKAAWTWMRIGLKLQPIFERLGVVFQMKFSVNAVVQALALALQGLNQVMDFLPAKAKFWAMIAITAIQGVVAILAHFSNPDGTPAAAPYIKP
jgi:hypothetical protein